MPNTLPQPIDKGPPQSELPGPDRTSGPGAEDGPRMAETLPD